MAGSGNHLIDIELTLDDSGSHAYQGTIQCGVVPRIGEKLDLAGLPGLRLKEDTAYPLFVVSSSRHCWKGGRLVPCISAVRVNLLPPRDPSMSDEEWENLKADHHRDYEDRVYTDADNAYPRWPPFA